MKTPIKISVVLPVRNEIDHLPRLLHSLSEQDFPPEAFELIVADGGSEDGTREFVEQFAAGARVRTLLVDNPQVRSAAGRNAGARRASGEFVVFIDGHCHAPSNTLLRDTEQIFEETGAHCLCRPQPLLAPTSCTMGKAIAAVRASLLGHGRDSLIYNLEFSGFVDPASSGASYRKTVLDLLGGYDEQFDACEDVEFNTRLKKAGLKAYSDPRLAIYYSPRESLAALARQMIRYGRGRTRLALKHPDSVSKSQFAPAALVALFFCAFLSTILRFGPVRRGWWAALPLYLMASYLVAILSGTVALVGKYGAEYAWRSPLIYLVIHLGLGTGMLIEMLAQAGRWLQPPSRLAEERKT